jgi:hypothetical protein
MLFSFKSLNTVVCPSCTTITGRPPPPEKIAEEARETLLYL